MGQAKLKKARGVASGRASEWEPELRVQMAELANKMIDETGDTDEGIRGAVENADLAFAVYNDDREPEEIGLLLIKVGPGIFQETGAVAAIAVEDASEAQRLRGLYLREESVSQESESSEVFPPEMRVRLVTYANQMRVDLDGTFAGILRLLARTDIAYAVYPDPSEPAHIGVLQVKGDRPGTSLTIPGSDPRRLMTTAIPVENAAQALRVRQHYAPTAH